MNEVITKVRELIERDNLTAKTRKQETVYQRAYLMHVLRCQKLTFSQIGKMFNLDHATAIHHCKQVEIYVYDQQEFHYMNAISEYLKIFESSKFLHINYDLLEDIKNCKNIYELRLIQKRLEENKYEIDATLLE